jgi:transcriptional regulator GlxA family with amidase domain
MSETAQTPPRRILIVAPPRATLQDVTGPWEVFCRAATRAPGRYRVEMVSAGAERLTPTKFGLPIACDLTLAEVEGEIDTVLVAGGHASHEAGSAPELAAWLAAVAPRARRMGSICTGAFHLAEAGLLDGRRAATHWAYCERLAARFPEVRVDPEPVYVKDGAVWSSAGITAGIDLALALVEEDLGPALAHEIARELVVFLRRPADQAQISAALARQKAGRASIRELLAWLPDHLDAPLGAEAMARLVNMSLRTFARAFAQETGTTPARHVAELRLEAARRRLGEARLGLEEVAIQSGFGSLKAMDRLFRARLGTSAAQYRTRLKDDDHG